jgi:glycosyltransferase involved in cell wall biosynthesis
MKLLIYSHFLAPSVGGVETIVLSLARGLAALRDSNGAPQFEITLIKQTPAGNYEDSGHPFHVSHKPGFLQLGQLIRKSDVVHVAGPALAPLFLAWLRRSCAVLLRAVLLQTSHPAITLPRARVFLGQLSSSMASLIRSPGRARHCSLQQAIKAILRIWAASSLKKACRYFLKRRVCFVAKAAKLMLPSSATVPTGPVWKNKSPLRTSRTACASPASLLAQPWKGSWSMSAQLSSLTVMEETAGLAALEQMVRVRPVIASAIGGLGEIVQGAGLTFSPNHSAALATAMARILDEPTLRGSLGVSSRQRVLDSFSFVTMIEAHAHLFRELGVAAKT